MKEYYYFIVEGVHDTAALRRFLKLFNIKSVTQIERIDSFWKRTIPTSFPHNGDLQKRMPVPQFFQNDEISIAIQTAGGDSKIVDAFEGLWNIDYEKLSGLAIFCDADDQTAEYRFNDLTSYLTDNIDEEYKILFENLEFNQINVSPMKFSIFVFPNNKDDGTLEKLLLEGGEVVYPHLLDEARKYVASIPEEYKRHWRPSSESKVLFGVVANVLKPGKANQVSIQDNEWISLKTIEQVNQVRLYEFLKTFIFNM